MMNTLQKFRFILVLLIAMVSFHSCEKEDLQLAPESTNIAPDEATDPNDDTSSTTNTGSNAHTAEEGDISLYKVAGGKLIKVKDYKVKGTALALQQDKQKHQEIWALVKKIVPANYLAKISEFILFTGETNDTAGYVAPTADDLSRWKMGIAIDFAYQGGFNANGELAYTIVHEFGHILTLDNTQVNASITENSCQNYFTGEGCAKKAAYINQLQTQFWADIWEEFSQAQEDYDQLDAFYNKYQDRFVTAYAATNPGEDIAEVFATFVTQAKSPTGNSIAAQKIQLMYDNPELVALRNFIRNNGAAARGNRFLPAAGSWKKAQKVGNPKKVCVHHKHAA